MFSPKAVMLCLQIWALWFWLSLQIWNFENIFHSLTSNNWIKYSELCLPSYLMIFNRFFDPIIGSLIHNSINLVMFPFYNWHLSSSQSLKLIEDLFCDTLLPNIGSFDSKIELVDDYFLQWWFHTWHYGKKAGYFHFVWYCIVRTRAACCEEQKLCVSSSR